jgi:CHASE3 domain sensor protein
MAEPSPIPPREALAGRVVKAALALRTSAPFAIGCGIQLIMGLLSYRDILHSGERSRWVRDTFEVQNSLDDLLVAMTNLESITLRFALTGDDADPSSSRSGRTSVEEEEGKLGVLTLDNSERQRRLSTLRAVAVQKTQFSEMVDNLRRSEGFEAAAAVIRIGRDQQSASPSFRCPATALLQVRARRYSVLILLDLNLSKMDGGGVLAQIKGDTELKVIPTLILTTSDARADIIRSHQLQANVYLPEPAQLHPFESLVESIKEFWLMNAKLPLGTQGA